MRNLDIWQKMYRVTAPLVIRLGGNGWLGNKRMKWFVHFENCWYLESKWYLKYIFFAVYISVYVRHNSVLWKCVRLCYICNEKPYTDRTKSSLCFIPYSDFIIGDNCKGGHYLKLHIHIIFTNILSKKNKIKKKKIFFDYFNMVILCQSTSALFSKYTVNIFSRLKTVKQYTVLPR